MRAWDQGLVSVGTQQHSIGQTMQQVDSCERRGAHMYKLEMSLT